MQDFIDSEATVEQEESYKVYKCVLKSNTYQLALPNW